MEKLFLRFPSIAKRGSGVSNLIANANRRTSLATIGAVRLETTPKSIIYQLPEAQILTDKDKELRRPLLVTNEDDCEFIRQIGELPKPEDPLEYDYM